MNQPQTWHFGAFALMPAPRLLLDGSEPVRVGGRALDLLIVLVEGVGHVVGRDELMASVWKKVIVDEGTLHADVASLRRALRDNGDATAWRNRWPIQSESG